MFVSYFMLTFSEAIAHLLSSPYNSHIRTALDACWSFGRTEIKVEMSSMLY